MVARRTYCIRWACFIWRLCFTYYFSSLHVIGGLVKPAGLQCIQPSWGLDGAQDYNMDGVIIWTLGKQKQHHIKGVERHTITWNGVWSGLGIIFRE